MRKAEANRGDATERGRNFETEALLLIQRPRALAHSLRVFHVVLTGRPRFAIAYRTRRAGSTMANAMTGRRAVHEADERTPLIAGESGQREIDDRPISGLRLCLRLG